MLRAGLWLAMLAISGCAALPRAAPQLPPASLGTEDPGGVTVPVELDELTRAFADRYVGLLSSACDALKKDNPDPVQRREAQELMLNAATNVYDIASNADAFTRMLDLVVVTTLVSQVWIDDDRAGEVFGDRAEVLVRTLHHGRGEAWALAAQVLRPDQLDLLDYLIWDWRRKSPDMVRASFVRFSNFAVGRGRSADAEVVAAGGFFPDIGEAGQSIDEARLLAERMFYLLKRYPTLLRWQAAAMKDDLVATPEITTVLADVHRLSAQVEQLPQHVAAERQALLAAFDERIRGADGALTRVRSALADANALVNSMRRTSRTFDQTFKTADPIFARFDAWDRWSSALPGHRAFDMREYTEGVKELAVAVGLLNNLLNSSNQMLGSPEWGRRVEQVNQSADGRLVVASEQGQRVVNAFFWRACLVIGVFFAMLLLYRLASLLLTRRFTMFLAMSVLAWTANGAAPAVGVSSDVLPPYAIVEGLSGKVISVGDSTTTILLARAAAEFRRASPGVTVRPTAGLARIGLTALLEGRADIVPMSRALTPDEAGEFQKKFGHPPTQIKVAADALAVYVEKSNPLPGLTLAQLDGIFSRTQRRGGGSIETWGQLGLTEKWADRPIALYGYDPADGVNHIFRQLVLDGGEYRLSMRTELTGSAIVQGVAANPRGIGCASIFFAAKRVRAVPLAGPDGEFHAPTAASVRAHQYPLSRFLYVCVNKPPDRPLSAPAAEFVRFLLSREGQEIVAAGGNIPLDAATADQGRRALD